MHFRMSVVLSLANPDLALGRPSITRLARRCKVEDRESPDDDEYARRCGPAGALSEVGWVAQVLVNRTTGHVVDGHLRVELAISRGEPSVPVVYVELSEEEERLVLASLDPLAAMATAEKDALAALLAGLETGDAALAAMLADLADQHGIRRPIQGDPDELGPVPDATDVYVKAGDLWILGEHRLLCGDATNADDVTRLTTARSPCCSRPIPPTA